MSYRVQCLKSAARMFNLTVGELKVGRYQFFNFKKGLVNKTGQKTILEAESWLEGYCTALADIRDAGIAVE